MLDSRTAKAYQRPAPLWSGNCQACNDACIDVPQDLLNIRAHWQRLQTQGLRVSFAETGSPGSSATLADVRRGLVEDGTQRCASMRLACEQAQLRAQAAEMLERHGPIWHQIGQVEQSW